MLKFKVINYDGRARSAVLENQRGKIFTPAFMPVATLGAVKGISWQKVKDAGYRLILSNVYHLYLRPGLEVIKQLGGLHKFIGWDGLILTDSGGFQVFSLSDFIKVNDDGIVFRSHLDGSEHRFTPEFVIKFEEETGVDIGMVLDECAPYPCTFDKAKEAVERTLKWAKRSLEARQNPNTAIFAIVQGSVYPELRRYSALETSKLPFDGYAIGGVSVGEPKDDMLKVTSLVSQILPEDKPRYLMGVGKPSDIIEAVSSGVDLFDCVIPTRNARNGTLFTWKGRINIKAAKYKFDDSPVDENCNCYTCTHHSKAYLRHLYISKDPTFINLSTIHNVHFYADLMRQIRKAINGGYFKEFSQKYLSVFKQSNA